MPNFPRPPRMCTVSHCREILPVDYEYLRCERHRVQNRHHSKLKRVRDKEVKTYAYEQWAAAVTARRHKDGTEEGDTLAYQPAEVAMDFVDEDGNDLFGDDMTVEALAAILGLSVDDGETAPTNEGDALDDTPLGAPSEGVPPAVRGTRRTNHVCSVKACYNLLSPSNPWKMCELCRLRDRAGRQLKALRDSGLLPPELMMSGRNVKEKKKEKEKKKKEPKKRPEEGGEDVLKKRKYRKKAKSAEANADEATASGDAQAAEQGTQPQGGSQSRDPSPEQPMSGEQPGGLVFVIEHPQGAELDDDHAQDVDMSDSESVSPPPDGASGDMALVGPSKRTILFMDPLGPDMGQRIYRQAIPRVSFPQLAIFAD